MNTRISAAGFGMLVGTASVVAVPPTINVTWAESPPPAVDVDYEIDATDPDFPNVELKSESLTWQIWSVDTDNPDDIGAIGDITATGAFDYGLTLEDESGGPGALTIGSIDLHPSDESNFSNIVGGTVTGDMTGDLFLQEASGGAGGTIDFTIEGDLLADVTLPDVLSFTVEGDFGAFGQSYTMSVRQVASATITIEGVLRESAIDIDGPFSNATLQIGQTASLPASITIDNFYNASHLNLGYLLFNKALSSVTITIGSDIGLLATLDMTNWEFSQAATLDFGTNDVYGTITFGQMNGDFLAGDFFGAIEIIDGFGTGALIDLAGDMRLRWTAAGLLMAEKQFRRIRGCRLMPRLIAVLDQQMDQVECPSEAA